MEQIKENCNHDEEIKYLLSGSGCKNLQELKLAFDHLKNVLFVKYGDSWDEKKIAKTVCDLMYGIKS
jgi:hypothetical protein